jgi:hypothetical protein
MIARVIQILKGWSVKAMKRIHINQHVIRRNMKKTDGVYEPTVTVKDGKKNTYCYGVDILGPCSVVYSPDKPLSCGAKVWIETDAQVVLQQTQISTGRALAKRGRGND